MTAVQREVLACEVIAPRHSQLAPQPLPAPGPGEVLVQVVLCGVCSSELPLWRDPQPAYPVRLGHEPSGIVVETGPGVTRFRQGDRVTGLMRQGFATHVLVREELLLHVPEGVPFEHALGEPLGCLINGQRRTEIPVGGSVAVVGLGFMGLGALALSRLRGPSRLIGIDPRAEARVRGLQLGADEVYAPDDVPERYLLIDLTRWARGTGVDVVIEAAGVQASLDLAGQMVRAHGVLSIAGYHQDGRRTVDLKSWGYKAIDVVNAHARRLDYQMECMRRGLDLIAAGLFSFAPLVTHSYGLDELDAAYTALSEKPAGFVKAIVRM